MEGIITSMMKRKIRMLFSICYLLFLFIVIAHSLLPQLDGKESYFGYQLRTVMSNSMEPTILTGSLAILEEVDPDTIHKGDIVTFQGEAEQAFTHRVVNTLTTDGGLQFQTKGDHNEVMDSSLVASNDIEGKYLFSVPYLGDFMLIINTSRGKLALILTIVNILLTDYFIKLLFQYPVIATSPLKNENREEIVS
ncbi:signal peptidase I [Amphibacillus sp. Q70]|uniref:signal peptidase I n=1 Tax=Amphibacillus sp. Q70 TaxID=3453416 RepID=UPI003F83ECCF